MVCKEDIDGTAILVLIWILLTFWVEVNGKKVKEELGEAISFKRALIVYDPDPFYNFDKQICKAFENTLARH